MTDVTPCDPLESPDPMDATCTAMSKQSGERCKRRPIPGGFVCASHGGNAPQTRDAARRRIAAMADHAAAALVDAMETAEKPGDRIRAAAEVLDRAGVSRHTASEAERTDNLQTYFGLVLTALDHALRGHSDQKALREKFYAEAQHIVEQWDDSD